MAFASLINMSEEQEFAELILQTPRISSILAKSAVVTVPSIEFVFPFLHGYCFERATRAAHHLALMSWYSLNIVDFLQSTVEPLGLRL